MFTVHIREDDSFMSVKKNKNPKKVNLKFENIFTNKISKERLFIDINESNV